jgi:hypothetical protein
MYDFSVLWKSPRSSKFDMVKVCGSSPHGPTTTPIQSERAVNRILVHLEGLGGIRVPIQLHSFITS